MDPIEDDPESSIHSLPENRSRFVREDQERDMIEFSRPSYCIKCKMMTGHNTPPRLVLIKNGRPAMSSFCWNCRSRKIRFVSFRLYLTKTGKKSVNILLFE